MAGADEGDDVVYDLLGGQGIARLGVARQGEERGEVGMVGTGPDRIDDAPGGLS